MPVITTRHGERLTERELVVLIGLSNGISRNLMAKQLGISAGTIHVDVQKIMAKLGAHDKAHAVAIGFRTGVIS